MSENAWRRLQALSNETEIWWDSSPLVWPNFVESYMAGLPEEDRAWFKNETDGMFLDAPVENWAFKGCTTNPPLSWAVIQKRTDEWVEIIKEKRKSYKGKSQYGLFKEVYLETVKRGAEKLLPLFEASDGKLGHISGQVDPNLIKDEAAMKEMADEVAAQSPNVMVKIPASTAGIPIFKYLASKGIATNATTCFNVPQIMAVAHSVAEGRKEHLAAGGNRKGWKAVITQMSGRLEDSAAFRGYINKMNMDISPLELRVASEAVVKKTANLLIERDLPLKMLQCSARKHIDFEGNVFYPHIEMFAGGPLVYTVPPAVIGDYLYHYRNREIVNNWNNTPDAAVMDKLLQVPYFKKSYEEDGYAVEQFDEITSLKENAAVFSAATNDMIDFVGKFV
ncbi:MAG: transaldolase family protein [Spirochaetales bacterium]|uniref:Transaldolase family protein n=1 Tax=Candidatus Thalassospirochaeta sargassi TaxID=3119039 RepID=A0AAJ1MKF6_9SPIO|nr:transaldolase family protein [Spirochaetales bacterium]